MSYKTFHCIYTDTKHARFSIVLDHNLQLQFIYWLELKVHGIRDLKVAEEVCAQYSPKQKVTIERGLTLASAVRFEQPSEKPGVELYESEIFDESRLKTLLQNTSPLIIFRHCRFNAVNLDELEINKTCAFFDCDFDADFRLIECHFSSDLWFSNSRFHKHFSVKSSRVEGSIHMESCDFKGPGGASFRGVRASNIYLDFGCNGCDDIVWLNEITISDVLSIGGTFNNDIELIGNQDQETMITRAKVGAVYIGHELYESETANATLINAKLKCRDCDLNTLSVNNTTVRDCAISASDIGCIILAETTVEKDLTLSDIQFTKRDMASLSLDKTSVERHLRVFENHFVGNLILQNSTIDGSAYFEDNEFNDSRLLLNRLSANRLVFLPIRTMYQTQRKFPFSLTPKRFIVEEHSDDSKSAEAYCTMKNWFSDSGQLDAEDDAYFFMRHKQSHNQVTRLIFGYIFGWGVRLRNIAISSVVLIFLFVLMFRYCKPDMNPFVALALSVQGFTGNFFGKWPDYEPSGLIAGLTVLESIFGLIFITVFIGAYIRKLLR